MRLALAALILGAALCAGCEDPHRAVATPIVTETVEAPTPAGTSTPSPTIAPQPSPTGQDVPCRKGGFVRSYSEQPAPPLGTIVPELDTSFPPSIDFFCFGISPQFFDVTGDAKNERMYITHVADVDVLRIFTSEGSGRWREVFYALQQGWPRLMFVKDGELILTEPAAATADRPVADRLVHERRYKIVDGVFRQTTDIVRAPSLAPFGALSRLREMTETNFFNFYPFGSESTSTAPRDPRYTQFGGYGDDFSPDLFFALPKFSGVPRSVRYAIDYADLDGDGVEEAVVLGQGAASKPTGFAILKLQAGQPVVVACQDGVTIASLVTTNGQTRIRALTWPPSGGRSVTESIFEWSAGGLAKVSEQTIQADQPRYGD